MIGIYFSGTGNTKYCVQEFLKEYDESARAVSVEEPLASDAIKENDVIVFAYPIYFSNLPKIVYDFIRDNKDCFEGKKIFVIATMALFSGDGAGCSARIFKKYGAMIVGGLHLNMPDCIGDVKLLKKSLEKNKQIIKNTDKKIISSAKRLKEGNPTQEGLGMFYHIVGLFGQRLWFFKKTREYSHKLNINWSKCVECGLCSQICPKNNFKLVNQKYAPQGNCTMCYRCVSNCPKQAITLLGKEIHEQCKLENYID